MLLHKSPNKFILGSHYCLCPWPHLFSSVTLSPHQMEPLRGQRRVRQLYSEKVLLWLCKLDLSGRMGGWGGVRTMGAATDPLRNESRLEGRRKRNNCP